MKGSCCAAMRVVLNEIDEGRSSNSMLRISRGWTLFLILPRLLLYMPPRGGKIPKVHLQRRVESFSAGEWGLLLAQGKEDACRGDQLFSRRRRRHVRDNVESRAARAEALVQMGELSAARQALEGVAVAPGDEVTRAALQDPSKRPPVLRDPIPAEVMNAMPATPLVVDPESITRNLRSARRGAAAGPSGMIADHLRVVLESEHDTALFCRAAQDLARAHVPPDVLRTIAQMIAPVVEAATSPFQCALTTKSGGRMCGTCDSISDRP